MDKISIPGKVCGPDQQAPLANRPAGPSTKVDGLVAAMVSFGMPARRTSAWQVTIDLPALVHWWPLSGKWTVNGVTSYGVPPIAGLAELADALGLGPSVVRRVGSIPTSRTRRTACELVVPRR